MSSRRYVEEVKKLVEEEDLDEILLGIPEKPDNFGKRILAKAKYDVVKRIKAECCKNVTFCLLFWRHLKKCYKTIRNVKKQLNISKNRKKWVLDIKNTVVFHEKVGANS